MPMAMSDDQDPTSFLSSTAVDLPRYLGLASFPTDPSLQIAISPPHGVHGTSFNWYTSQSPFRHFFDNEYTKFILFLGRQVYLEISLTHNSRTLPHFINPKVS